MTHRQHLLCSKNSVAARIPKFSCIICFISCSSVWKFDITSPFPCQVSNFQISCMIRHRLRINYFAEQILKYSADNI